MSAGQKIDWREGPVAVANEHVPVVDILRRYGCSVPEVPEGVSVKLKCIWGFSHPDGGTERSMRVYGDSNTAQCFNGCGPLTPVRITAEQLQIPHREAARSSFDEYGLRPLHWSERAERSLKALETPEPPSLDSYGLALVTSVRTIVGDREYDQDVISFLSEALSGLTPETEPERWLEQWKASAQRLTL